MFIRSFIVLFVLILSACSPKGPKIQQQVSGVILPAMVEIEGGSFIFGCDDVEHCNQFQKPVQELIVPTFEIGATEVTFSQWQQCVDAGVCIRPRIDKVPGGDYPVTHVSWRDIQSFLGWLNDVTGATYRLPSEAEWEYVFDKGNTSLERRVSLQPVASVDPNSLGVYDLNDNLFEYMADCFIAYYRKDLDTAKAIEKYDCRRYVRRGQSWAKQLKGDRFGAAYNYRFEHGGFRLAKSK